MNFEVKFSTKIIPIKVFNRLERETGIYLLANKKYNLPQNSGLNYGW